MKNRFSGLLGQGLMKNMAALCGVQLYRKAIPLVTMPYLANILGPAGWGMFAFVQGFAAFLVVFIEFGFEISATRAVARCADEPEKRAEVLAGVLGAQAVLGLFAVLIAVTIRGWIPIFRDHGELVWAGLFFAIAEGTNLTWYFLGIERMGTIATLEIVSKSIATAGIFMIVKSPEQVWVVLMLQALAPLLSTLITLAIVYRGIPFRLPSPILVRRALVMGWSGFLFRSAESVYTIGNVVILGLLATPVEVGYFAGAEKISRAFFGLLNPLRQTMYARLSSLVLTCKTDAARLARLGTIVTGCGGVVMGGLIFCFAPYLIHTFLGEGFQPAVGVLKVLAFLPPLMSVRQSLGFQWLLPMGKESTVNRIILRAGFVNLGLAALLGSSYAHTGAAYAVVISEIFVGTSMIWAVVAGSGEAFALGTLMRCVKSNVVTAAAERFVSK